MEQLPSIAGATPPIIWYTILGLLAFATIYNTYVNVIKSRRYMMEIKDQNNSLKKEKNVTDNLEPRFAEIDRKLANDKALLDSHTRQIETLNKRTDNQDTGMRALCHGMLALLDEAERAGNGSQEITDAKKAFTSYLADK